MRVLVVDDSPELLAIARFWLEKEGHTVACAGGGADALLEARETAPDLVLLDIDMPEVTGFDVCRALKSDAELSLIPIIFLTASDDREDIVRGLDLGAVDYVTKPFDPAVLAARVRASLRTKRLQDLLCTRARMDPLTELPNRRAFDERLQDEWYRAERYGSALSLVMLDIDHFKRVNDTWGHRVGDQVIQEVADQIRGCCRRSDSPARFGGEEFVVLTPAVGCTGASRLAERIRAAVAALEVPTSRGVVRVTLSAGVAEAAGLADTVALVEGADTALYRAKQTGRDRVVVLPPPTPVLRAAASANG